MKTYEIKAKQVFIYTTKIQANSEQEAKELAITDLLPEDFDYSEELEFSFDTAKEVKSFADYYLEREDYANKSQGTSAISEALTKAGIENTIEQTGGFCMVVYVYSEDKTKGIALNSTGLFFEPDVSECDNWEDLTPDDFLGDEEEGCRPEICEELVELVKKNLYLLN
jgi:hypothetical protein